MTEPVARSSRRTGAAQAISLDHAGDHSVSLEQPEGSDAN
jgi:hypothetical protein